MSGCEAGEIIHVKHQSQARPTASTQQTEVRSLWGLELPPLSLPQAQAPLFRAAPAALWPTSSAHGFDGLPNLQLEENQTVTAHSATNWNSRCTPPNRPSTGPDSLPASWAAVISHVAISSPRHPPQIHLNGLLFALSRWPCPNFSERVGIIIRKFSHFLAIETWQLQKKGSPFPWWLTGHLNPTFIPMVPPVFCSNLNLSLRILKYSVPGGKNIENPTIYFSFGLFSLDFELRGLLGKKLRTLQAETMWVRELRKCTQRKKPGQLRKRTLPRHWVAGKQAAWASEKNSGRCACGTRSVLPTCSVLCT